MKVLDHEYLRMNCLKSYQILDSEEEKCFDSLTQLAAHICESQMAVISLIDRDKDRQWFKSKVGIDASETPLNISFCAHAILQNELFIIEDATKDERFKNHPLVVGEPYIRFYAGAILRTPDGYNLGTLCVVGDKHKTLTVSQREALLLLADQVMVQFELRLKTRLLEEERIKTRQIMETINASPDFIGTCDLKGNITFCNEAFSQAAKIDNQENIFTYHPERVNKKFKAEWIPHARKHGLWSGESAVITKDGKELPVWQTIICHRDNLGVPQFFSTHMQDLSERKTMELKLLKNFSQLGTLVENIPAAIAMLDRDFKYLSASKNWISEYDLDKRGYTRNSIVGQSHYDVFPSLSDEWKKEHKASLQGLIIKRNDVSFVRDDGKTEWINYDVRPWYDENGEIGGIMMLTEVITDKKNAEIEILKAKSDAVQASQAKSIFLANMSHEIRTPLNSIIGLSDILVNSELDEENARHVSVIQKSSEVLLSIINDILDLTKIESGEFSLEENELNLATVAQEVMDVFTVKAKEKNINLISKVDASIPLVKADITRMHQILINLLGNALKFTSTGEIVLTITKNPLQHRKGNILISIKDSGVGIDKNKHDIIFENFGQAETTTTRKFGGTGLGLAITRKLVQKMKGEIWVESELGKGSEFSLTLSLSESQESKKVTPVVNIQNSDFSHLEKKNLKILLVDDSVENRSLILAYLKKFPFQIITAENGIDALELMKKEMFDVVLMDVQMPIMDGLTATSLYRAWEKETDRKPMNIIALTAYALQEEKVKCLQAGCNLHLTKPIKKVTVLETIDMLTKAS